jgi:hypothetical protein
LLGAQAQRVTHRGGIDIAQSTQQSQNGVMQKVASLFPAAYRGEVSQHFAGEVF